MKLSIIIPTCRRSPFIFRSFESVVVAATGLDAEIILIDDNPRDPLRLPDHLASHMRVYPNVGQGLAAGRNTGARRASGDWLLFMDDDILVEREQLVEIMRLQASSERGCFNLNWRYPDDLIEHCHDTKFGRFILRVGMTDYKSWAPELDWQEGLFEAERIAGFFMTMPKTIFEEAGGFDPRFPLAGMEDYELCRRLRALGVQLFIEPRHFVLHNEVDKVDLVNRLNRLKAGAYNRRLACDMGMMEFWIGYSLHRRAAYGLLSTTKRLLLSMAQWLPNKGFFDPGYYLLVQLLIGTVIFEAFHRGDNTPISA